MRDFDWMDVMAGAVVGLTALAVLVLLAGAFGPWVLL